MGYRVDALPRTTDAHVIVRRAATAAQSAVNLLAAYARAKLLTPGGIALSATNRAVVLVPPGWYDLAEQAAAPAMDLNGSFVGLIGLGSREETIITSTGGSGKGATIRQTARDAQLHQLTILNEGDQTDNYAFEPKATQIDTGTCTTSDSGGLGLVTADGIDVGLLADDWVYLTGGGVTAGWYRVKLVAYGAGFFTTYKLLGIHAGVTYTTYWSTKESYYKDCLFQNVSGTVQAKNYSPIRSPDFHIDGTWEDCEGGDNSWLPGDTAEVCATMRRCKGGYACVGADTADADVSGLFVDCEMGERAFGGCGFSGCDVSGTFYNCRAGHCSWATGKTFSGAAYNCRASGSAFSNSFGSYHGTFSGYAEDCVTIGNSFGAGTSTGKMTGRLVRCRSTGLSAPIYLDDADGGARVEDCVLTVGVTDVDCLYLNDSASVIHGSTLLVYEGGTGFPINAGGAVNAVVDHCRMNNYDEGVDYQDGLNANVMNLVANPYNSVDSDIAY